MCAEAGQIAPLVGLTEGVFVIGAIAGINLSRPEFCEKRLQRLIDKRGVGEPGSSRAGLAKQLGINSGTQAYAIHATIMARAMTLALPAQRPQRPQRPQRLSGTVGRAAIVDCRPAWPAGDRRIPGSVAR